MALLLENKVASVAGAGHGTGLGHALKLAAWHWRGRAQHVTGQLIRAIPDEIQLRQGWHEAATSSSSRQRCGPTTPGTRIGTGLLPTRAPGLH